MVKSKFKKSIAAIISAAAVSVSALCVGALSGCKISTDHPEAQITIEFAEKTYTLDYTLYRNMYPNTVQHFIELADNGFYNNIVIHDYHEGGDWITGGYEYNDTFYRAYSNNADMMGQYFQNYSLENKYASLSDKLTPTVYSSTNANGTVGVNPLNTLIGEFYNNINQVIENGALTAEYGCLKMFYYTKSTSRKVYVSPTSDQLAFADYKNNCATSLFTIQTGSSSDYGASDYCVFAKVGNTDTFEDLITDVKEYFEDNYGDSTDDYSVKAKAQVDINESYSDKDTDKAIEQTFAVTRMPIVIKSVKITKY